MVDFTKLTSKKLEDVERPPLVPIGHYRFRVDKLPEQDTNPDSDWYIIEFQLRPIAELEDVDPEELQKFGGIGANTPPMRKAFMCDRTSEVEADKMLFQVKRFLIDHLRCADESMSIAEGLAASLGATCVAQVVHKQDKQDAELFHANVGRTAADD